MRPEGLAIYLLDEEAGRFERAHLLGHGVFPDHASPTLPLLAQLERERRLLFRDEVESQPHGTDPVPTLADFAGLGSEVLVPLIASSAFSPLGRSGRGIPSSATTRTSSPRWPISRRSRCATLRCITRSFS